MHLRLFAFLILFCFSTSVIGQKYNFKQYTTQDGLAHNSINDIIQAGDHRIWIATPGGLSSFNGSNFKNYNVNDGLSSNYINTVFEDSKGRIWIGTRGKGASILENGTITNLTNSHPDNVLDIAKFLETKDGTILMFGKDGILTYKNGDFTVLNYENKSNINIVHFDVTWYDDNTIYIATLNYGIAKLTLNPTKIEFLNNNTHDFNNICYSVLKDDDQLWIGTYGEIVCLEQDKVLKKEKFNTNQYDQNRVYDIFKLNNEELLLAFEGNGFGIYNKHTKSYQLINHENGLPTPYIYQAIKDNEGNIWLATDRFGLIKYNDLSFWLYDTDVNFPSNEIIGVLPINNDEILVATDQSLITLENGKITTLVNDPIYGISRASESTALIATFDNLYKLTPNYGKQPLREGHYRYFYSDSELSILYRREQFEFLKNDQFFAIEHQNRSKYFLGIRALNDRYILSYKNAMFQYYNNAVTPVEHLDFENSYLFAIDTYNDDHIVVGDINNEQLSFIKFLDDSTTVKNISFDRLGMLENPNTLRVHDDFLWIATQNALKKIDLPLLIEQDSVNIKNYYFDRNFFNASFKGDSHHNLEFNTNGVMIAASSDGLLLFDEKKYNYNSKPPSINLDNVKVFSESLSDSLYRENGIDKLPYTSNYLTFTMEAITFSNAENVKYKYRLKGLRDGDLWSAPTHDNQVIFSYLPPGKYSFEFTADNGNNVWQKTTVTYPFEINNPFWKSIWFWTTLILVVSACVLFLVHRKNKIKQLQAEKFSKDLLTAQEEERSRISKDLHDSVGQQLTLLKKKAQNANQKELSELTNTTLEEVRSISRGLYPATLKQLGLSESIEQMLYDLDEETELFFSVEIDNINNDLNQDKTLNFYRFIQEAIHNVVKHSKGKAVTISITKTKNSIEAFIKDNGVGFDSSTKIKEQSLGLKTMAERIKILQGTLSIKSKKGQGTTVKAMIPI